MFFEVLNSLCKKNNISMTQLALNLGISRSNVTNWKNGSVPKIDKVNLIADYFNVSTDLLINGYDSSIHQHTKSDGRIITTAEISLAPIDTKLLQEYNKKEAITENLTTTNDSEVNQSPVRIEVEKLINQLSPEMLEVEFSHLRSLLEIQDKNNK